MLSGWGRNFKSPKSLLVVFPFPKPYPTILYTLPSGSDRPFKLRLLFPSWPRLTMQKFSTSSVSNPSNFFGPTPHRAVMLAKGSVPSTRLRSGQRECSTRSIALLHSSLDCDASTPGYFGSLLSRRLRVESLTSLNVLQEGTP